MPGCPKIGLFSPSVALEKVRDQGLGLKAVVIYPNEGEHEILSGNWGYPKTCGIIRQN